MLIGLTSRIAAGKGVIKDFLEKKGFEYHTFSDVVREEAGKLGIEITRKNLQDLGNDYRIKFGAGIWAKKIIEKLDLFYNYVIDGIRNPAEIIELKKIPKFYLIALDAPQRIRYERVIQRAKPSDPKDWDGFLEIDERDFGKNEPEYGQQVQKCMKMADYFISNGFALKSFEKQIEKVYNEILKNAKW
ncbi:MAG: AAA family ATPase [Nanoarchaeota archaeon]